MRARMFEVYPVIMNWLREMSLHFAREPEMGHESTALSYDIPSESVNFYNAMH